MFDVIALGSAVIDVFLNTEAGLFGTHKNGSITVPFGSKVIIKEIRFNTGGGGTNTAVSFARMGLKTAFIGNLSGNKQADFILNELKLERVDTSMVIKRGFMSGYSAVLDARGHDRTILAYKGSNNDIKVKDIDFKKLKQTKWVYMTSMMGDAYKTSEKVAEFCGKNKIKLMFNPSSYLAKQGAVALKKLLKNCSILVYNKEEAAEMVGEGSISSLLEKTKKTGPEIVIITDGEKGSHTFDGKNYYFMKGSDKPVIETTGAGDSFGSGFLAAYIRTKGDIAESLKIAQVNAASVITHHGAKNNLLTWGEAIKKAKKIKVEVKSLK